MAEKLKTKRVALSLAGVSAILYIACALLIFVVPNLTIKLFSYIFHGINISSITDKSITLTGTLIGLVEIVIYALITGALFAWIYNKIN